MRMPDGRWHPKAIAGPGAKVGHVLTWAGIAPKWQAPTGGGSTAPSSTPLVVVYANAAPTVTAGSIFEPDWSSATMDKGDAWSGVTGSALNLDVDQDSGSLYYPAGEGIYDLQLTVRMSTGTLTDVGKSVGCGFKVHGSNYDVSGFVYGCYKPLRQVTSSPDFLIADLAFAWTDLVWVDNTSTLHTRIRPFIDAKLLTADIGADNIQLMVIKRA